MWVPAYFEKDQTEGAQKLYCLGGLGNVPQISADLLLVESARSGVLQNAEVETDDKVSAVRGFGEPGFPKTHCAVQFGHHKLQIKCP